jgi:hypothetical protein
MTKFRISGPPPPHQRQLAGPETKTPNQASLSHGKGTSRIDASTNKRACHTLWTAKLSLHDAASTLPYYMGASDLSEALLNTMLTTIVEATRLRCTLGTHVPRERLCGPPERDGLGMVDPRAQNAGEKVTTMLRLLNSPKESATHALAAHALSIVQNGPTRQARAKTMPTARGAMRGLAEAPVGEEKWGIV